MQFNNLVCGECSHFIEKKCFHNEINPAIVSYHDVACNVFNPRELTDSENQTLFNFNNGEISTVKERYKKNDFSDIKKGGARLPPFKYNFESITKIKI